MPMRPCVDCGRPTSNGTRCERCDRPVRQADDARRNLRTKTSGRSTAHWQRLRARVLERDGHTCRLRLPGCTIRATSVHLRPELRGDHRRATEADCLSACAHCHGTVDAPRAAEAARRAQT